MLLSIIRQNQKLAAKRNPAFDRNRFAKFLIYFMVAFWAAYLIFIGVMLSFAFEDIFPSMEPYHIMNQGLIYLLILDFCYASCCNLLCRKKSSPICLCQ